MKNVCVIFVSLFIFAGCSFERVSLDSNVNSTQKFKENKVKENQLCSITFFSNSFSDTGELFYDPMDKNNNYINHIAKLKTDKNDPIYAELLRYIDNSKYNQAVVKTWVKKYQKLTFESDIKEVAEFNIVQKNLILFGKKCYEIKGF